MRPYLSGEKNLSKPSPKTDAAGPSGSNRPRNANTKVLRHWVLRAPVLPVQSPHKPATARGAKGARFLPQGHQICSPQPGIHNVTSCLADFLQTPDWGVLEHITAGRQWSIIKTRHPIHHLHGSCHASTGCTPMLRSTATTSSLVLTLLITVMISTHVGGSGMAAHTCYLCAYWEQRHCSKGTGPQGVHLRRPPQVPRQIPATMCTPGTKPINNMLCTCVVLPSG